MTFKEAIENRKKCLARLRGSMAYKPNSENETALLLSIEAMEKQVPFTPEPDRYWEGKCKCGVVFLDRATNYCGNCGQKLDWGNEE